MNKTVRVIVGVLVSAGCLWFVFRNFDYAVMLQTLSDASYWWFIPMTLVFCMNMGLRSIRWKTLLSPLGDLPFRQVTPKLLLGFFMNSILPARGGEVVRAVALSKSTSIPISSILGTIVAERVSDLLGLMVVILCASRLLPWAKLPVFPIFGVISLGIVGIMVFLVFAKKMPATSLLHRITEGFMALRSPRKIVTVIGLSISVWMGELLIIFFTSRVMYLDLSFFESAALLTGLSVGVMIPAAPGYVGTYEFFGKSALMLLGKPEVASLNFVLVLHFAQLALIAMAALPIIITPLQIKKTEPK